MIANHHLSDEILIGYIYRTLNDAVREIIDDHLVDCQICRVRLTKYEIHQRQIDHDLQAEINGITPPPQMTFAGIAPRLERQRIHRIWPRIAATMPLTTAVVGLILSLFSLWQFSGSFFTTHLPSPRGTLPTLACFCFMFVSMEQFDRAFSIRPRFLITILLTFALWLGTAVIGLLNILIIRDLVLMACIAAGVSPAGTGAATIMVMLVSAVIYIAAVIGGAEFHYKNIGQPYSWKLFSWTIVIQLLIMITPYLLF